MFVGVFSTVDMQQLYHWCLYGIKSSSLPTDSIQSNWECRNYQND